ncbi:XdhC family protein [Falsiroseomonas stagni]|uniref:Xanthine dehydrogenase accessory factor n=1 Tax=Falsiroseomonas stagni DSM 19981 TaxID=1123062 RepID=A0A1I4AUT4_9PROT|nr:XdhC family protein [Falsiroseomonas stagni]SFK60174.1 xanthine dehydrogenase accessory factor [Falsiroseomonas stagni DSM 19981]
MKADLLERLMAARAAKTPLALLTRLPDGAQALLPGDDVPAALAAEAEAAIRADAARNVTIGNETWFIAPENPPLRLIIVGAVHIAQALVPMALPLGFAVTVVDPRRAFATGERMGDRVTISSDWPDEAMVALKPDARTAVVTLTHDPKLDDPALEVALRSPAFYVGSLGSRKTHAKRVARLTEAGLSEAEIARIAAPVGLDIGAVTAPEIAVSILAQIVSARRGGPKKRAEA